MHKMQKGTRWEVIINGEEAFQADDLADAMRRLEGVSEQATIRPIKVYPDPDEDDPSTQR